MTVDVARLPRKTLKAGTRLYRIHRSVRDPWFFDGSGAGRFDPAGTAGRGACYWAEDPLGAWVEVFRTRMVLTTRDVADRSLSVATLEHEVVVRDLASRRALRAGVTLALTAGADYGASHALADALQHSAPAVRWRLRHDLAAKLIGVAWFGAEGLGSPPAPTRSGDLPDELVATAHRRFGYEVLPEPLG